MLLMKKLINGYAVLVLIGGLMGFIKAGSTMSLLASTAAAILLLTTPMTLRVVVVFALDCFFVYRFATSSHFFPGGMMALLSSLTLLWLFVCQQRSNRYSQKMT